MDSSAQPTHIKLKQPAGFYVLFLTEVWERFGFYTICSLLMLFMVKRLGLGDTESYTIFGAFTALLYITPSIGGFLADKVLGYRRTLWLGLILLAVGYIVLTIPTLDCFYPGLAFLVIGCGLFKSMPYALLTELYKGDKSRLDGGFTLYYLAIQVGGIAPLAFGGFAVEYWGWNVTFGFAAIGMLIGVLTYGTFRGTLKHADRSDCPAHISPWIWIAIAVGCVVTLGVLIFLFNHLTLTHWVIGILAAVLLIYLIVVSFSLTANERGRLLAALLLSICGMVFISLYYQAPMSLTLFVDRNVHHEILGINLPSSSFWVFNPIWILILGPMLNALYQRLHRANRDPSIAMKFGLGICMMAVGYAVMVLATYHANFNGQVSPWWVVVSYAFQSMAELLVNALGTAMIARLVPSKLMGVMMGVWFFTTAIGGILAGMMANLSSVSQATALIALETLHVYRHAFIEFTILPLVVGIITCIAARYIMKLTRYQQGDELVYADKLDLKMT